METPVNNSKEACVCRKSVDRDDRDVTGFAMPAENVVHRRIVDSGVDKDGLIFGKVLYQFRKIE